MALPVERGAIADAVVRPDGSVDYLWSSATSAPQLVTIPAGRADPTVDHAPAGPGAGEGALALTSASVSGGGGDIPVLIARPDRRGAGPHPTVFLIHGGPGAHDADAYLRLVELAKAHEFHAYDRGHEARAPAERIDEMATVLAFVDRHLPA